MSYDINGNSSVYENINNNIKKLCPKHIKYKELTELDSTKGVILCDSSVKPDKIFTDIQKIFKDIKEENKSILKNFILIQLLDNDKWLIENTQ